MPLFLAGDVARAVEEGRRSAGFEASVARRPDSTTRTPAHTTTGLLPHTLGRRLVVLVIVVVRSLVAGRRILVPHVSGLTKGRSTRDCRTESWEEALIRWDDSCSRTPVKNTSMVGEEQGQARKNSPTSRGSVAGDTRFPGMAAIVHPRRPQKCCRKIGFARSVILSRQQLCVH